MPPFSSTLSFVMDVKAEVISEGRKGHFEVIYELERKTTITKVEKKKMYDLEGGSCI